MAGDTIAGSMRLALGVVLCACCACSGASDPAPSAAAGTGGDGAGGASGSAGAGGSDAGPWPTPDGGSDAAPDAPPDAASDASAQDAAVVVTTLLDQPGVVFVPSAAQSMSKIPFGDDGTVYRSIRVEMDVLVGDWQPEIPDEGNPDRTEHILFGLFRANQTKSDQRYLMGAAAVTFATKAPHFRMFGRTSIGPGYTTYTQWSATYAWQKGETYHLDCLLDAGAHQQRCELRLAGSLQKAHTGEVAYLDAAAHLSSGFYLELGRTPPGEIETAPIGWTYSNLRVVATLLP